MVIFGFGLVVFGVWLVGWCGRCVMGVFAGFGWVGFWCRRYWCLDWVCVRLFGLVLGLLFGVGLRLLFCVWCLWFGWFSWVCVLGGLV